MSVVSQKDCCSACLCCKLCQSFLAAETLVGFLLRNVRLASLRPVASQAAVVQSVSC